MRTSQMTTKLLPQAELLCRSVAPHELANLPIYIVPVSRLPPELGGKSHCIGYTTTSLDLHLQDYIHDWQGRGPCMVINDLYLERTAGGAYESDFFGTVLHELAHILERSKPYREREVETVEQRAQIAQEAVEVAKWATEERYPPQEARPWDGHEGPFMRIAFHLWHRHPLQLVIHPMQIFDSVSLHLSSATKYAAAFEDEATRMADAPFKEILAMEYPDQFLRLLNEDIYRFLSSRHQKERMSA